MKDHLWGKVRASGKTAAKNPGAKIKGRVRKAMIGKKKK